ncbi:adenine-specific DNA-methyltransferase [Chlorobaculum sp. 24CR]|uniref:adenine-specific DNA-methyltransferase n=1 Tax=Chlorobaculum sp. 24CR TaxID=2508878 RepID=UPI00100A8C39|nr:adenine-specific DNA-methyltransferase [Chlorobaculum sp. 24CR]
MGRYQNNGMTIIMGDAMDVLASEIPDGSVSLIFADPPYNIGKNFNGRKDRWESDEKYLDWCYRWISLCIDKLAPDGSFYLMAATQSMPFLDIFIRKRLTVLSRIVWSYDSSGVQAKRYFGSLYEPILHCVKNPNEYTFNADDILVEAKTGATRKLIDYRKAVPTPYNSMKVPGNVWNIPRVRYRMPEYEEHPTQKPIALLERIILASSNPGDLVLDPFSGTFTTGVVAQKHNRHFVGIEIEEAYVKIGIRRLEIAREYKGELLHRPPKSYETSASAQLENLTLFEKNHDTSVYGNDSRRS